MTSAEMKEVVINLINPGKFASTMFNLWSRWQDEKEYEDINEYGLVLAKLLPDGMKIVRTTKKPFGIVIADQNSNLKVHIFVKINGKNVLICGKTAK